MEGTRYQTFFEKKQSAIDVTVKMLYGTVNPKQTVGEDIIGQYVLFTKVFNEQVHLHGWTREAVSETIRICKDQDILKEYLATREKEVITMMMDLYDQDRIMEIHIASEKKIAAEKAAKEATRIAAKEAAKKEKETKEAAIRRFLKLGKLTVEEIADCQATSVEDVRKIEAEMLQNA
ncbi:MAG: hypothetical protein LUD12_14895 [Lachnospiraceae bacterium]|nr:hypothetical protein [Lachnospiraceae bacterium]